MTPVSDPGHRVPWKAGLLSFLCPGLGQIYNGQVPRGLAFMAISGLLPLAGAHLARLGFGALGLVSALYAFVTLYFFYDAVRQARLLGSVSLGAFQRADAYLAVFVAFTVGSYAVGNLYPVRTFQNSGQRMFPGLRNGDRLLADQLAFRGRLPVRGELVLFKSPEDGGPERIGRVIGLPGDTVEIRERKILVNDQELVRGAVSREGPFTGGLGALEDEGARAGMTYQEETSENLRYLIALPETPGGDSRAPEKVPEGKLFVLNDRRDMPEDSRKWGFLDADQLVARPLYVLMSIDPETFFVRWTRFGRVLH